MKNIKNKNGPKIGKFWSPEPGNEALESSRRRRKDGGLRLSKFHFQKFQGLRKKFETVNQKLEIIEMQNYSRA